MSTLMEENICFCIQAVVIGSLVKVYEENSTPLSWKGEEYLNSLLDAALKL